MCVCTLYDVGDQEGVSFLVMEHLEGETLAERLARVGPLTTEDAARCATEIASALDKAHTRKIIHRDLKPSNVMLTESGAKVLDFGIATRDADPELATVTESVTALTDQGAIAGTVPYMAPEALRGEPADARSDVWGLGVVLYEMLGGQRPFTGSTGAEVSSAILRDPPPPLPKGVPSGVETIVQRCLKKDPTRAISGRGKSAPPAALVWTAPRLSRRGVLALAGSALVAVAAVGGWNLLGPDDGSGTAGSRAPMTALAVLPFDNLSGDDTQDYLSEGMTDALITELSKIGALTVASRTAVRRFQDTDEAVPAIARTLGADAVVSGSIVVAGDQVRVTAQLIDGTTDQAIWAESFDRAFTDILALQGEIAQAVAMEVRVAVTAEEAASLATTRPVNRQAYEAYLTGQYHARRWPDDLPQAVEAFETAIVEDPAYAPAYAGLSVAYSLSAYYGSSVELPNPQRLPRAKDLADRALAFDDSLAQAHLANGIVKMAYEWDWAGAKAAFERSLALDPDDSSGRMWYGCYMSWIEGRSADAVAFARETLEQDPFSLDLNTRLAMFLYFAREFDEAIEVTQLVLGRDPSYSDAKIWLGHALAHTGRMDEAAAFEVSRTEIGEVIAGRSDEIRRLMQPAVDRGDLDTIVGWYGGYYNSILGDLDGAFAALNNYEVGDALMTNGWTPGWICCATIRAGIR